MITRGIVSDCDIRGVRSSLSLSHSTLYVCHACAWLSAKQRSKSGTRKNQKPHVIVRARLQQSPWSTAMDDLPAVESPLAQLVYGDFRRLSSLAGPRLCPSHVGGTGRSSVYGEGRRPLLR